MSSVVLDRSPNQHAPSPRVHVGIQLAPDLRDAVARIAQNERRPFSAVVREALQALVAARAIATKLSEP